MSRVDEARQLAAELTAGGVFATVDPAEAQANLPAVLIVPPELGPWRYGGPLVAWRLVALAEPPAGLASWEQLDQLVEALAELVPLETARPGSYTLAADVEPLPAYICTASD